MKCVPTADVASDTVQMLCLDHSAESRGACGQMSSQKPDFARPEKLVMSQYAGYGTKRPSVWTRSNMSNSFDGQGTPVTDTVNSAITYMLQEMINDESKSNDLQFCQLIVICSDLRGSLVKCRV